MMIEYAKFRGPGLAERVQTSGLTPKAVKDLTAMGALLFKLKEP